VESAKLGGVVLDSSVLIAAERRGYTVREILEQVHASHGDIEVGISVVTIAELARLRLRPASMCEYGSASLVPVQARLRLGV
jgi:predicted nucleic acid-binding protein